MSDGEAVLVGALLPMGQCPAARLAGRVVLAAAPAGITAGGGLVGRTARGACADVVRLLQRMGMPAPMAMLFMVLVALRLTMEGSTASL